jgi:uncharacterized membrane protein
MTESSRLPSALAYVPIVGWLYVLIFQRTNNLAMFHLRQSIGLFLFLAGTFVGWAVIGWLLSWIPFMAVVSIALFALVIAAFLYSVVAWIIGLLNALRNRVVPLPLFGRWASRLPIR